MSWLASTPLLTSFKPKLELDRMSARVMEVVDPDATIVANRGISKGTVPRLEVPLALHQRKGSHM